MWVSESSTVALTVDGLDSDPPVGEAAQAVVQVHRDTLAHEAVDHAIRGRATHVEEVLDE